MRLKRLELVGFKSFASRIKLDFDHGITAIVGPNGSGKSNISDAVRWVLGEQSIKSLRGSKLEDVIFAGADGKKPMGMAEVQLTLENIDGFLPIDYSEVTITRRVYRSGDSDFLINNRPCRLKDVHDLFTDTGLGKEGYAIIGQGQIDSVLSTNSEDRRILLEETAGIIRYKNRKQQAKRKIEETDYDLVRVTDILGELNQQLIPLEREANKARKYQQLANALHSIELDLFAQIKTALNRDLTRNQLDLEDKQGAAEKQSSRYQELDLAINKLQQTLSKLEEEIDQSQNKLMSINETLSDVIHNSELTHERELHNSKHQIELCNQQGKLREEIATLHQDCQELQLALTTYNENQTRTRSELDSLEARLANLRDQYQQKRKDVEDMKTSFVEFMRDLTDARNFGRNYQQQEATLKTQLDQAMKTEITVNEEQSSIQASINQELQRQKQHKGELEQARAKIASTKQEILAASSTLKDNQKQEDETKNGLQQIRSRLLALQELDEEYEGYNYSVRKLMQGAHHNIPLLGTVADVIKVPAGLETAYEVALGANLQNVLTATEEDAKAAIAWLKKERAGRATFLPLNTMKAQKFPANYQRFWEIPHCLGPAVELLDFDPKYLPAIAALLGRVVITQNLDTGLILQKQIPSFGRIVTKAGELIMPSGALTGGSIHTKSAGLLTRKTQIDKLIQQEKLQQHKLESAINLCTLSSENVEALNAQISKGHQQFNQVELELQSVTKDLEQLHTEQKRLAKEKAERIAERESLQVQLTNLEEHKGHSHTKIAELETEEVDIRTNIRSLESTLVDMEAQLDHDNEKLTEMKIVHTNLTSTIRNTTAQLEEKQQLHHSRQQDILQLQTEMNQVKTEASQLQDSFQAYQLQRDQLANEKANIMQLIETLKTQRTSTKQLLEKKNRMFKQIRTNLGELDKQIHNLELAIHGIQLELKRTMEEVAEREFTINQLQECTPERTKDDLIIEANRLKQDIQELGTVNLGALEEYEAVKERCFFLQEQVDDLRKAKDALQSVIEEMDTTSEQKLRVTFQRLRMEFQQLFTQLFQGGKADLILTDPDHLLATGIDIVAQPPGKKAQNLLLLSGGERSLIAIALLFSIRRVKPTPFCILDEIDAALDDVNLDRFAKLMTGFTTQTQFLVITHRQGTMESSDRLYGVTTSETATSQLMSVQLSS